MEHLKRHLSGLPDERAREAFAADCGTTLGHMRNAIYSKGAKRLSPAVCSALHLRHGIPRWHMRPEDWHLIWPELIGADGAPPAQEADEAKAA